eukprot:TRINITY_DN31847_c0_g1_i1.p1 TRINITY_DN31847_c0_g1~~TRINITY_DN31847_c0_g1_i1.p1  ORF type:complete len:492 (-),score=57.01 TRINITY_DN31847_c0_g1_i1:42-1484(-)
MRCDTGLLLWSVLSCGTTLLTFCYLAKARQWEQSLAYNTFHGRDKLISQNVTAYHLFASRTQQEVAAMLRRTANTFAERNADELLSGPPKDVVAHVVQRRKEAQRQIGLITATLSQMRRTFHDSVNATMRTSQLTEEKMRYELKNMPPPQHPFPVPPRTPETLADQRKRWREDHAESYAVYERQLKSRREWEQLRDTMVRKKHQPNNTAALTLPPEPPVPDPPADFKPRNLIMCMSSVQRQKNYLLETVRSLFHAMSPQEKQENKLVIFNAMVPPSHHEDVPHVQQEFAHEIATGSLEIITNPSGYRELLPGAPPLLDRWFDPPERVRWRAKHALDTAYVMAYCMNQTYDYYLHLEDDISALPHFPSLLREWTDTHFAHRNDWTMLAFYNPWRTNPPFEEIKPYNFFGVIGQLLRRSDVETVMEFLRKNFDESPLDWLFVDLLTKFRGRLFARDCSLFQHEGRVSSFHGKTQSLRALRTC